MATTEAIDVVMPQMGVSVSEGTITKWLKQQGEQVEADEPLLEISTDKVDTEVPSPGSGVLSEILVQEGQTVDVGTKLAVIGGDGASGASGSEPQTHEAEAPAPATAEAAAEAEAPSSAESPAPTAQPAEETAAAASTNGKTFVSPVVAKIASEHGVDPSQVQGTGRGGRVTKKDILNFIESGAQPAQAARGAPARPRAAPAAPQPARAAAPPAPPSPAPSAAQPAESFEPMTAMRKGIAEHMRRSLDTSA